MMWRGTVSRIDGSGAYVKIADLGNVEHGPLWMCVNFRISDVSTAGLQTGDIVLVGNIGVAKDDLAIIGVLVRPTAPATAPPAGDSWPGW